MRHMSTTLAMGAWTGFFAIWSTRLADQAGAFGVSERFPAEILQTLRSFGASWPVPLLSAHQGAAFAALFAALTIASALSMAVLASRDARRPEALVSAVLCAAAVLFLACRSTGSTVATCFGDGPSYLVLLALTFGALLFDRLVAVDDGVADDVAFQAILRSLREAETQAARDRWNTEYRRREGGHL